MTLQVILQYFEETGGRDHLGGDYFKFPMSSLKTH